MSTKLLLSLDETSSVPLYEQLTGELRRLIAAGNLTPGQQIPSVRELSKELTVSVGTVRRSLTQLLAEGWLVLKRGSGTYVSETARIQSGWFSNVPSSLHNLDEIRTHHLEYEPQEEVVSDLVPGKWAQRLAEVFDETRFYARYDESVKYDFRVGTPVFEPLSGKKWMETLLEWSDELVKAPRGYTHPAGITPLREEIANWLNLSRGMQCTADDVFIVSGAQQARNLVSRLLINPGTRVAMEEPGSIFARMMFQSYNAEILPVCVDESGLVVDELRKKEPVSILYLAPSAQFPTGAVLSQSRRAEIAAWAKSRNAMIIEDDNNCEFTYESRLAPAIRSFDAENNSIYIGTFSQTIMPPWRIGYMVVPKAMREPLFRLKWLTDRCTSPLVQHLVLKLLQGGFLKQHLKKALRMSELRRETLIKELQDWPPDLVSYTPVKGGLHQTLWLPAAIDDVAVFNACFEQGVGVLPVSPCFATKPARPGIMLNFSAMPPEQLIEGMAILRNVLVNTYGT